MIEIGVAYPTDPIYEDISRFAREVYHDRIQLTTTARPNFFAYAIDGHTILGCIGLYKIDARPEMFFEMCRPPRALERLAGEEAPDRRLLAEIGTRVVRIPDRNTARSRDVSLCLCGALMDEAFTSGIRYVGFITNRFIESIAQRLGFTIIWLGTPDFSSQTEVFRTNMDGFLRARQYCGGIQINTTFGCHAVFEAVRPLGYRFIRAAITSVS